MGQVAGVYLPVSVLIPGFQLLVPPGMQDYKLAISSSIISDTSEVRSLTSENLKQIFRHLDNGGGSLSDALNG